MLEGLPPNNAAHMMRLVCDETRARAIADLVVESFEPSETAASAFETETPLGKGKAWMVEVYFGFAPDEDAMRELVAAAAGEAAAAALEFGRTPERDWVANALAGLAPVRAGRFLVHGAHDRARVRSNDIAIEIEAALAFGTGHHGTTRGCLLHLERVLRRRRPRRVLDVGCGTGVLAIAAAKALRRKVWLGDIDPVAVLIARDNARLNGVGAYLRPLVSRGVARARIAGRRALRSGLRQYSGQAFARARALARRGDRLGRRGDRLGAAFRRRSRRSRGLARAGLVPRGAHRS